jgi:hypothetical protein
MAASDFTLIGSRFSRLVVTSPFWADKFHIRRVRCICDCGSETEASCQQLVKGIKKSCGCLRRDAARAYAIRMAEEGKIASASAGSVFGRLTIKTGDVIGSGARRKVLCICACGADKVAAIADLRAGKTTSCGCYQKDRVQETFPLPIGERFGRLVIVRGAGYQARGRMVEAQCDCGKLTVANIDNIRNGHTSSCGCQKVIAAQSRAKHGHSRKSAFNRTYSIYRDMRTRCENPKYREFHLYGGRGITVCARWRQGYEFFLADMGERPPGMSLERERVNEGYSPDNCKWATDEEQANNKRNNVVIEHNGKSLTIAQWARELNVGAQKLYYRHSQGWPPERILAA